MNQRLMDSVKRLVFSTLLFGVCALNVQTGLCQELQAPRSEEPPVDGAYFQTEGPGEYSTRVPQGSTFQRQTIRIQKGYVSRTLRGTFLAQWMYIVQRGQRINFWGARIISLSPDSPLRQLELRPGDVITRLDGTPIWHGMARTDTTPWQLPELENHFGGTEVRYINQGRSFVRVGQINIDTDFFDPDDDGGFSPLAP